MRLKISIGCFVLVYAGFFFGCKESRIINEKKADYYTEKHRPQYHFSPESGWMNDPNGMVFHDEEYHLFYQYYPNGIRWDTMHWGHAVSSDMVHWDHLPIGIYPDSLGYIFSGSAVMDYNNTSGLGEAGKPPMVAIFTHHNMYGERSGRNDYQVQSIAYSLDNGRTFTKYKGNPVVSNPGIKDFRDPKVIWDDIDNQWIMVFAAYDKVRFYTSPNLIDWTFTGTFGIEGDDRLWECPDLFPLKVIGTDESKWVLITSIQKEGPNGGTATSYFIGDWDGKTFIGNNNNQKWLDYGTDNYALVSWSDIPQSDGRRVALGWMSNWQYAQEVPTERWRSAMTLPRELQLVKKDGDYELLSIPVRELDGLIKETKKVDVNTYNDNVIIYEDKSETLLKLELVFQNPREEEIKIRFSNDEEEYIDVGFKGSTSQFFIDRRNGGDSTFSDDFAKYHTADGSHVGELIDFTIFLDHSSIEVFADGGHRVMTDIFFPSSPFYKVELIGEGRVENGQINILNGIW